MVDEPADAIQRRDEPPSRRRLLVAAITTAVAALLGTDHPDPVRARSHHRHRSHAPDHAPVTAQKNKKKRCKNGTTRCGKTCLDLTRDRRNCGRCGKACGASEVCDHGACVTGCTVCPSGCSFTSVKAALAGSAKGEAILVAPGTYDADLILNRDVTIRRCGESGEVVLRNATSGGRAVTVQPGVRATLEHLAISRKPAFQLGGGVLNLGTLSLKNCALHGNAATTNSFRGAGLENQGSANLTGCSLSDNAGMGLGNRGDVTLTDCLVQDHDGYPLYNRQATMSLTGCTVKDNTKRETSGLYNNGGIVTIAQSTFTGNTGYQGGAIFSDGKLTVTDSIFRDNSASFEGGAIFAARTLVLQQSELSGNSARVRGGGLSTIGSGTATVTDSQITGNAAGSGGGVAINTGGSLIMNHCTILDNSTQPDDTFAYGLEGGGLAISGVASLSDCTISRNHAHKRGGGLAAPGLGGNGRVDLKSCTITHNVADEEGGGLYCPGGMITVLTGEGTTIQHNTAKFGAGIYNEQGVIMLADCIIDSNDAEGTGGGILIRGGTITFVADGGSAVTNNTAGVSGGGILAQAAGAVTLNGTPVSGNTPDNCAAAQAITGCEG